MVRLSTVQLRRAARASSRLRASRGQRRAITYAPQQTPGYDPRHGPIEEVWLSQLVPSKAALEKMTDEARQRRMRAVCRGLLSNYVKVEQLEAMSLAAQEQLLRDEWRKVCRFQQKLSELSGISPHERISMVEKFGVMRPDRQRLRNYSPGNVVELMRRDGMPADPYLRTDDRPVVDMTPQVARRRALKKQLSELKKGTSISDVKRDVYEQQLLRPDHALAEFRRTFHVLPNDVQAQVIDDIVERKVLAKRYEKLAGHEAVVAGTSASGDDVTSDEGLLAELADEATSPERAKEVLQRYVQLRAEKYRLERAAGAELLMRRLQKAADELEFNKQRTWGVVVRLPEVAFDPEQEITSTPLSPYNTLHTASNPYDINQKEDYHFRMAMDEDSYTFMGGKILPKGHRETGSSRMRTSMPGLVRDWDGRLWTFYLENISSEHQEAADLFERPHNLHDATEKQYNLGTVVTFTKLSHTPDAEEAERLREFTRAANMSRLLPDLQDQRDCNSIAERNAKHSHEFHDGDEIDPEIDRIQDINEDMDDFMLAEDEMDEVGREQYRDMWAQEKKRVLAERQQRRQLVRAATGLDLPHDQVRSSIMRRALTEGRSLGCLVDMALMPEGVNSFAESLDSQQDGVLPTALSGEHARAADRLLRYTRAVRLTYQAAMQQAVRKLCAAQSELSSLVPDAVDDDVCADAAGRLALVRTRADLNELAEWLVSRGLAHSQQAPALAMRLVEASGTAVQYAMQHAAAGLDAPERCADPFVRYWLQTPVETNAGTETDTRGVLRAEVARLEQGGRTLNVAAPQRDVSDLLQHVVHAVRHCKGQALHEALKLGRQQRAELMRLELARLSRGNRLQLELRNLSPQQQPRVLLALLETLVPHEAGRLRQQLEAAESREDSAQRHSARAAVTKKLRELALEHFVSADDDAVVDEIQVQAPAELHKLASRLGADDAVHPRLLATVLAKAQSNAPPSLVDGDAEKLLEQLAKEQGVSLDDLSRKEFKQVRELCASIDLLRDTRQQHDDFVQQHGAFVAARLTYDNIDSCLVPALQNPRLAAAWKELAVTGGLTESTLPSVTEQVRSRVEKSLRADEHFHAEHGRYARSVAPSEHVTRELRRFLRESASMLPSEESDMEAEHNAVMAAMQREAAAEVEGHGIGRTEVEDGERVTAPVRQAVLAGMSHTRASRDAMRSLLDDVERYLRWERAANGLADVRGGLAAAAKRLRERNVADLARQFDEQQETRVASTEAAEAWQAARVQDVDLQCISVLGLLDYLEPLNENLRETYMESFMSVLSGCKSSDVNDMVAVDGIVEDTVQQMLEATKQTVRRLSPKESEAVWSSYKLWAYMLRRWARAYAAPLFVKGMGAGSDKSLAELLAAATGAEGQTAMYQLMDAVPTVTLVGDIVSHLLSPEAMHTLQQLVLSHSSLSQPQLLEIVRKFSSSRHDSLTEHQIAGIMEQAVPALRAMKQELPLVPWLPQALRERLSNEAIVQSVRDGSTVSLEGMQGSLHEALFGARSELTQEEKARLQSRALALQRLRERAGQASAQAASEAALFEAQDVALLRIDTDEARLRQRLEWLAPTTPKGKLGGTDNAFAWLRREDLSPFGVAELSPEAILRFALAEHEQDDDEDMSDMLTYQPGMEEGPLAELAKGHWGQRDTLRVRPADLLEYSERYKELLPPSLLQEAGRSSERVTEEFERSFAQSCGDDETAELELQMRRLLFTNVTLAANGKIKLESSMPGEAHEVVDKFAAALKQARQDDDSACFPLVQANFARLLDLRRRAQLGDQLPAALRDLVFKFDAFVTLALDARPMARHWSDVAKKHEESGEPLVDLRSEAQRRETGAVSTGASDVELRDELAARVAEVQSLSFKDMVLASASLGESLQRLRPEEARALAEARAAGSNADSKDTSELFAKSAVYGALRDAAESQRSALEDQGARQLRRLLSVRDAVVEALPLMRGLALADEQVPLSEMSSRLHALWRQAADSAAELQQARGNFAAGRSASRPDDAVPAQIERFWQRVRVHGDAALVDEARQWMQMYETRLLEAEKRHTGKATTLLDDLLGRSRAQRVAHVHAAKDALASDEVIRQVDELHAQPGMQAVMRQRARALHVARAMSQLQPALEQQLLDEDRVAELYESDNTNWRLRKHEDIPGSQERRDTLVRQAEERLQQAKAEGVAPSKLEKLELAVEDAKFRAKLSETEGAAHMHGNVTDLNVDQLPTEIMRRQDMQWLMDAEYELKLSPEEYENVRTDRARKLHALRTQARYANRPSPAALAADSAVQGERDELFGFGVGVPEQSRLEQVGLRVADVYTPAVTSKEELTPAGGLAYLASTMRRQMRHEAQERRARGSAGNVAARRGQITQEMDEAGRLMARAQVRRLRLNALAAVARRLQRREVSLPADTSEVSLTAARAALEGQVPSSRREMALLAQAAGSADALRALVRRGDAELVVSLLEQCSRQTDVSTLTQASREQFDELVAPLASRLAHAQLVSLPAYFSRESDVAFVGDRRTRREAENRAGTLFVDRRSNTWRLADSDADVALEPDWVAMREEAAEQDTLDDGTAGVAGDVWLPRKHNDIDRRVASLLSPQDGGLMQIMRHGQYKSMNPE
ncbi:MAG: hypothetical protein MHM6MM_000932 [Cercozoa sp. M6MM]